MIHTNRAINILLGLLIVLDFSSCNQNSHQSIEPSSRLGVDYDYVYCLAGEDIVDHYVPPRDLKALGLQKGRMGDYQVTYNGFPPEARTAFQYAVDIWDSLLDSDVSIVVSANFTDLNSGVLGSAAPSGYYENFSDKAEANIEYSVALAEKIAGENLNRSEADLNCNFSNSINWFYDFNNPETIGDDQFDFVSVVLHELGHGLGFLSRRTGVITSGNGFIGAEAPIETDIFSLLLETGDGSNLLLNFEDGSPALGEALTNGDLFFNSHGVPTDPLPEIYAPGTWNGGSSLSHLDNSAHSGTDALMTPSIGRKEVLHDPAVALTMMYDMGWKTTFISHYAVNQELINIPIPIKANIFTDAGIGFDSAAVKLVYSQDSFATVTDTLVMNNVSDSSLFEIDLPGVTGLGQYQYYIFLDDTLNNQLSSPRLASSRFHNVLVGEDAQAPIIDHIPIQFYFLDDDVPTVVADIDDEFTGVANVSLEYKVNQEPLEMLEMNPIGSDQYSRQFQISFPFLGPEDSISYRIVASDNSINNNTIRFPNEGFNVIDIKATPDALEFYENNFNEPTSDFTSTTFSVRLEPDFDNEALHSAHPYINAGTGNEFNFTARLRIPIDVIEEGKIEFDEVVLVEPGEPNTNFGDSQFWDYVIVEASKDNGSTWIALADGYDSGDKTAWKSVYDAGVSGSDSSSDGNKDLLIKRTIPLYQPAKGIQSGDRVILRWRLFSDPFAVGWGWVIDNLKIQEPNSTTPIVEIDRENEAILLFPNPVVGDELNIKFLGSQGVNEMWIANSSGQILSRNKIDSINLGEHKVDVSSLTEGAYFVVFKSDDIWITKPFIKL